MRNRKCVSRTIHIEVYCPALRHSVIFCEIQTARIEFGLVRLNWKRCKDFINELTWDSTRSEQRRRSAQRFRALLDKAEGPARWPALCALPMIVRLENRANQAADGAER